MRKQIVKKFIKTNKIVQDLIKTVIVGVLAPLMVKLINKLLEFLLEVAVKVLHFIGKIYIKMKTWNLQRKINKKFEKKTRKDEE